MVCSKKVAASAAAAWPTSALVLNTRIGRASMVVERIGLIVIGFLLKYPFAGDHCAPGAEIRVEDSKVRIFTGFKTAFAAIQVKYTSRVQAGHADDFGQRNAEHIGEDSDHLIE